jgi:exoribonuclease II
MKLTDKSLVIYKSQPAIVVGYDMDKIEIDTPSGKKKVREKDVILLHSGPCVSLSRVSSAPTPQGNLMEAYDFFTGDTPSWNDVAELVWGTLSAESAWNAWREISGSPWFVAESPAEPIRLRPRDEAEAIIKKADSKKNEEADREAFLSRFAVSMKNARASARAAHAADSGGAEPATGGVDLANDGKYLQDVEALALGKTDKSRTLRDARLGETPETAHRSLVACGYWPFWKNPFPARHGHTLQTSSVQVPKPDDGEDRLDLTGIESFAIDNEWSNDPDDAVCVVGDTLWVHIADPASTVTPDSPADRDARSRGSTLYVPEGAARMLEDKALEWYALGIEPVSRALSFGIAFTDTGAVSDVEIVRSRVRVTRLTYAQASARKNEPVLAALFAIAERNIARRRAAGAVFIDLPEVHISLAQAADGSSCAGESTVPPVVRFDAIAGESAADMVREMMLLAGEAVARFAFKNKIPFQYVSQETPDIPNDLPAGLAGEWRKRRSMRGRKVGTIPADHAGLGLGMYSQVTSPLRRYGDLVAHQQLRLFLDGKKPMDTDDMLTRIAQGDSASRECTLAERESNLHWTLVHLATHPEWVGDAVVVELSGPQATILIPEFAQEARIAAPGAAVPGSSFRVRAGNIDIPSQTVSFIPAEE